MVDAIGAATLQAIATAGPDMQVSADTDKTIVMIISTE